ncbi:class I SAM-dependent methyltransferase [Streptomyces sp. 21So2-11]|uniref:class I SAM-dependent methyltransferase n=1 Tax=Streptomyces sp. 21So2-11 TaxID=3144408 RepID=UPI003219A725
MTDVPRFASGWLDLRESADGAARASELLHPLLPHLDQKPLVIHDMGCGTGSMMRWLAPQLPGKQKWVLHDHDADLLALAAERAPRDTPGGSRVEVSTECGDLASLTAGDLAEATLVTASALLDVLTAEAVQGLVRTCTDAGVPALLTLSVVGRVDLTPADPMDSVIGSAFDLHQRRGGLLGPNAVSVASEAFIREGATVSTFESPWKLGYDERALTAQWLRGWVDAACQQSPDLVPHAASYVRRRLATCAAGELHVVVHHTDLLALPGTRITTS